MPFLKDLEAVGGAVLRTGVKAAEIAAPIAGAVVGGPAGAAAGVAISKKLQKHQDSKWEGGKGYTPTGTKVGTKPSFTPSSAGDVGEARSQDKNRLADKYGIEY